jgi:hypothetical protein
MSIETYSFVLYEENNQRNSYKAYLQYNGNEDMLRRLNTLFETLSDHYDEFEYELHLDDILSYQDMMKRCLPTIVSHNRSNPVFVVEKVVIHTGILDFTFLEEAEEYDLTDEDNMSSVYDIIIDNLGNGDDTTDEDVKIATHIVDYEQNIPLTTFLPN